MALVNITPVMTSNTAPAPYAVTVSSIWSATYDGWKAFNGAVLDTNDFWGTASGAITGWIKFDFGSPIKINALSLQSRDIADTSGAPKDFILYGSNDNITFEQIFVSEQEILWGVKEIRLFMLSQSFTYRYYRLNIISNNGASTGTSIGDIKFWQDDSAITYITNEKASMLYCLPKNSTPAMKARQNDPREGLLGFANDVDNYGTMWMVDNQGKAMIPKAAMADADLIFDGIALGNTAGPTADFTMLDSYDKYKYLLVLGGVYNGGAVISSVLIPIKTIELGTVTRYGLSSYQSAAFSYGMYFGFTSKTTFKIGMSAVGASWSTPAISKIYGIK